MGRGRHSAARVCLLPGTQGLDSHAYLSFGQNIRQFFPFVQSQDWWSVCQEIPSEGLEVPSEELEVT